MGQITFVIMKIVILPSLLKLATGQVSQRHILPLAYVQPIKQSKISHLSPCYMKHGPAKTFYTMVFSLDV